VGQRHPKIAPRSIVVGCVCEISYRRGSEANTVVAMDREVGLWVVARGYPHLFGLRSKGNDEIKGLLSMTKLDYTSLPDCSHQEIGAQACSLF
jgi:hypothetical protein